MPSSKVQLPKFLSAYSSRAVIYKLLATLYAFDLPGGWRFQKWGKEVMGDDYIKLAYLGEGKIWINPYQAMGREIAAGGMYEEKILQLIQTYIKKGFSYIDIGANIGLHAVAAGISKMETTQQFYAFEPEDKAYAVLEKNVESNHLGFFNLVQAAVGAEPGSTKLYVSTTRNQGNHSLSPREGNVVSQNCAVISLDTYEGFTENLAGKPCLIKVDVEGSEPVALQGATKYLSELDSLAIICEVSRENLERAGFVPADIVDKLTGIGCERYYLFGEGGLEEIAREQVNDLEVDTDILAVKGKAAHETIRLGIGFPAYN